MDGNGDSGVDSTVANAGELLVWAASGLAAVAVVLAGLAIFLVLRHQGFSYRANVRSTHHSGLADSEQTLR